MSVVDFGRDAHRPYIFHVYAGIGDREPRYWDIVGKVHLSDGNDALFYPSYGATGLTSSDLERIADGMGDLE